MNTSGSSRRINYSHAVLVTGLVLSLFVIMFRPVGADAGTPVSVDAFKVSEDGTATTVKLSDLAPTKRTYDVIPTKGKTSKKVEMDGYKLTDVLEQVGADTNNVKFIKIQYESGSDAFISLLPIGSPSDERPPLIMTKGSIPGVGPIASPAIVPGQPGSTAIKQGEIVHFDAKGGRIGVLPGKPDARILNVSLERKNFGKKQYKFIPHVLNGTPKASRQVHWFETTEKGKTIDRGVHDTFTTENATEGTAEHFISAVVVETKNGSTGTASNSFNARKTTKGSTSNPGPTKQTGSTNNTGTPGFNTQGGTGGNTTNNLPNFSSPTSPTGQAQQSTVTPPPSQPTESTSQSSPDVDTTAITNVAQNVSGTPGLHTVTGVLLSTPTAAPISASGDGTPLSTLPAPVANQLNSIFQPVDSTEDVWAYVLAVLFAFSISGAVREWVNP